MTPFEQWFRSEDPKLRPTLARFGLQMPAADVDPRTTHLRMVWALMDRATYWGVELDFDTIEFGGPQDGLVSISGRPLVEVVEL